MQLYAELLHEMLSKVSIIIVLVPHLKIELDLRIWALVSYVVSGCSSLSTTCMGMTTQLELGVRNTIDVRIPCKQPGSTLRG